MTDNCEKGIYIESSILDDKISSNYIENVEIDKQKLRRIITKIINAESRNLAKEPDKQSDYGQMVKELAEIINIVVNP